MTGKNKVITKGIKEITKEIITTTEPILLINNRGKND